MYHTGIITVWNAVTLPSVYSSELSSLQLLSLMFPLQTVSTQQIHTFMMWITIVSDQPFHCLLSYHCQWLRETYNHVNSKVVKKMLLYLIVIFLLHPRLIFSVENIGSGIYFIKGLTWIKFTSHSHGVYDYIPYFCSSEILLL